MQLFFEDIHPGDSWRSEPRLVTADDVYQFADLTGDHDPLHSDCSDSPFGQQVAHGLLGLSIMAGLSSDAPKVHTLALVRISDWVFLHPVFPGDHVTAITTVTLLKPYGRRSGRVVWERCLVNQDDRTVQRGKLETIVASRDRAPTLLNERKLSSTPTT